MSDLSDAIFDLIVSGQYDGGEKLNEVELATRLGVSRTPVREALKVLANTGVVVVEKNKGARVSAHSPASVEAAYAARSLLEPAAARLAMDHMSADDLTDLRVSAETMYEMVSQSSPVMDIAVVNNDFHASILMRCPNRRLSEMSLGMLKPMVATRTFANYSPAELVRSALHHLEIVDALEHRDGEWVEAIVRAHIRCGYHSALKTTGGTATGQQRPR
ncbi:GntR family transcriptional regulator [Rhodococcus sp. BP-149]|uniref:GntR family transcriptional regulator n=1 Tax=unclassified Rhodococcus (in: high G+C Gram-positive bacteria) TaxID=192944 RepID=UPI001C9AAE75|nr:MULTISPECIES: GntR family transcriptional regulator [unclassified Rhodococcus (in: high G+C Gram-positive bacteria)]MBY6683930.1 GntR family transcriptional regulator [Rhodococcus sp. BP-288]MBY6693409.1 GntR family transcriptional regulator [Rhodococcus sp. BP-188]MBY6697606.1 GntR family transcriptional regulator [Rhodococcus sp. BP-285]MBY6702283.1 GntR family transcriptional regulator [Rhodococcus sp. BP-283]MBY6709784.1 GntR family transcriptional regulator [Rhodococcus sp. BP-160]